MNDKQQTVKVTLYSGYGAAWAELPNGTTIWAKDIDSLSADLTSIDMSWTEPYVVKDLRNSGFKYVSDGMEG